MKSMFVQVKQNLCEFIEFNAFEKGRCVFALKGNRLCNVELFIYINLYEFLSEC